MGCGFRDPAGEGEDDGSRGDADLDDAVSEGLVVGAASLPGSGLVEQDATGIRPTIRPATRARLTRRGPTSSHDGRPTAARSRVRWSSPDCRGRTKPWSRDPHTDQVRGFVFEVETGRLREVV